jgi:hypothetical protein
VALYTRLLLLAFPAQNWIKTVIVYLIFDLLLPVQSSSSSSPALSDSFWPDHPHVPERSRASILPLTVSDQPLKSVHTLMLWYSHLYGLIMDPWHCLQRYWNWEGS